MPFVATHSPLLGTDVEVRVEAPQDVALDADSAAVDEFERLIAVFSVYDESSELSRWRRGEIDEVSPELTEVLAAAQYWHGASAGAFHPGIAALRRRWLVAMADDELPDRGELAELAAACAELPFTVTDGTVQRLSDCSGVDLNAIAKGYIVDKGCEAASTQPGVDAVMINAGGDLRHRGAGSVLVGIEDPAAPFDNSPPRWRVELSEAGLATSGAARRGFRIGGRWLGHVLDPRTGWPVSHTTSTSVIAPDAMTADALATVLGVLPPAEALSRAEAEQWACLLVAGDGSCTTSPAWPS
ncbi:MAG TPA: FAD:protein FMN transferase [Propionicimonas sp.]|jgi:thiamine biosynthesis lipoprotein|uniref:FAD:protein FMN transferase n=1 Tax=Propionicimonas sp. TaxID=1955623 RepID=UPI002F3F3FB3